MYFGKYILLKLFEAHNLDLKLTVTERRGSYETLEWTNRSVSLILTVKNKLYLSDLAF